MYYWIRDLRPAIADKVKDSVAPWQHVNTYGLSIGASGTISYPNGINAITSGTANWPPATGAGGPEAIDDLWHAAVNSRGKYFNASNAQQLAESIVSALADFTDQSGTGTAVGIGGAQLSVTNQYAYKTSYEAGIWGDVKKYAIDIDTGVLPSDANGNPLNAPLWSAATQLDAQAAVSGAGERLGHAAPHRDDQRRDQRRRSVPPRQPVGRAAGVPDQPAGASWRRRRRRSRCSTSCAATSRTKASTRRASARARIFSATSSTRRRSRSARRARPYADTGAAGSPNPGYNAFKSAKAERTPMVYVGSNDGMLHAIVDDAGERRQGSLGVHPEGDVRRRRSERHGAHAVCPASSSARSRFAAAASRSTRTSSTSTRRRACGTSISRTPTRPRRRRRATTGARCSSAGSAPAAARSTRSTSPRRSRRRRRSCRATPRPPRPAKVLWEFTDANLGYVYDAPTLVKTYAYGWVVLVASGYNNPGRQGLPLRAQSERPDAAPASC